MKIDNTRMARLIDLSKNKSHDPYERFEWPSSIEEDTLWCNEELLTTHGTEFHEILSSEQVRALSKWESVNFFSLNVHGIRGVLEFSSRCIYEEKYKDISEYLHVFIGEENFHMWFFAKACLDYAGKIYPNLKFDAGRNDAPHPHNDLYMFASTLIFEEFVDFYNHRVGVNNEIVPILKEINYQHHVDESRHVSFGRDVVRRLYEEAIAESPDAEAARSEISGKVINLFKYFTSLMYNPLAYRDADIYRPLGFSSGSAMRNALRNHPSRAAAHETWFKRSADFFCKAQMVDRIDFQTL
ncbi:diiron oxygenase [Variovorax sp. N23]|uniref:diiron oxygenase n=1 Tax=Variovorax sp. N23 TaxID=2980555 RepID=UPI0021CAD63C|nr:diiron oxygenase [Variovorax sp. N23]MCU4120436.1 diiron oxygenase [Variovorax sp. N23]